jgi:hypothetical protein
MASRVIDLNRARRMRGNTTNEIPARTYFDAKDAVGAGTATPQQQALARMGDQVLASTIARFRRAVGRAAPSRQVGQRRVATARPRERGSGCNTRTRGSRRSVASTSSSTGGDPHLGGDDGDDDPPGESGRRLLLADERHGRVNLPMLRALRAVVA